MPFWTRSTLVCALSLLLQPEPAAAQRYVFRDTVVDTTPDEAYQLSPAPPLSGPESCYDPEQLGKVGGSDWTGCEGMLIVSTSALRSAASPNVGGDGSFAIIGPDGESYGFAAGTRTIFTGQVTDFSDLFNSTNFNGSIGHWDTSSATSMVGMFGYNAQFNQPIGGWDTSKVTSMAYMFSGAYAFNQDLSGWDLSQVLSTEHMFNAAFAFNRPIGGWDVSNVRSMAYMFYSASAFNQEIGSWNVGRVTSMFGMFYSAGQFNRDIGSWDVSAVTNMGSMFRFAAKFNADLSGWCVPGYPGKPLNFDMGASAWALPRPVWGTCPAP